MAPLTRQLLCWTTAVILTTFTPSDSYGQRKHRALPTTGAISCQMAGNPRLLSQLDEASGVAISLTRPDILWSMNDSGADAIVLGLDLSGHVRETVRLRGAKVEDWEDIAVGPCAEGSCVYVADVGDNDARRTDVSIYRFPEPAPGISKARPERFRATYPDGPHDAEAFFVDTTGQLFIVTKGPGTVALYRMPSPLQSDHAARLEQIGATQPIGAQGRITGAAASPDGEWVVLRTHSVLSFYRMREFTAGTWQEVARVDLKRLEEPQGEGVTFGANNAMYLVSEGGAKSRPGVLNKLSCTLQQ